MRGVLSTLRLVPKDRNWSPRPTFDLLDRLLGWLRAAGDYREKVERLAAWRDYLHALPEDGAVAVLAAVIAFAEWFEEASLEAPGAYTVNVERFLEGALPSYSWREDVIFTARPRFDYHLIVPSAGRPPLRRTSPRSAPSSGPPGLTSPPPTSAAPSTPRRSTSAGPATTTSTGGEGPTPSRCTTSWRQGNRRTPSPHRSSESSIQKAARPAGPSAERSSGRMPASACRILPSPCRRRPRRSRLPNDSSAGILGITERSWGGGGGLLILCPR